MTGTPGSILFNVGSFADAVYVVKTGVWDYEEIQGLAEEIWVQLKLGQSIAQMASEIPTCKDHILVFLKSQKQPRTCLQFCKMCGFAPEGVNRALCRHVMFVSLDIILKVSS